MKHTSRDICSARLTQQSIFAMHVVCGVVLGVAFP
jgi:hypothetical protein